MSTLQFSYRPGPFWNRDTYNDVTGRDLQTDKNVAYCWGVFFTLFILDSQTSGFETVTDRIFGLLSVESWVRNSLSTISCASLIPLGCFDLQFSIPHPTSSEPHTFETLWILIATDLPPAFISMWFLRTNPSELRSPISSTSLPLW